jgi:methionyl-tRNA formyltransferase
MRVIFMGTPDFAVPALAALVTAGHAVVAVYTQPPRPARRGQRPTPSPVQRAAETLDLKVLTPANFRDAADRLAFAAHNADVAVVAAYGLILPQAILDAPRLGCINIHASLLPRWRGAAPIQRAILAGDTETGVTIMQMECGLDTGPTLLAEATPVDRKTAGALTDELAEMGARLVVRALAEQPAATPQRVDGVTYATKIDKAEAALDLTRPADAVERAVRAFNPVPGAFVMIGDERIRILAADIVDASGESGSVLDERFTIACGSAAIRPTLVQRAGRQAMPAADMLRGLAIPAGTRLGA